MTAVAPSRKTSSARVAKPDDQSLADAYAYRYCTARPVGEWGEVIAGSNELALFDSTNLNSHSTLANEPDGSSTIRIAPKAAEGVPESNRLPAPDGKPFSLTFGACVPKEVVERGEWSPPHVTRLR